MAHSPNPIISIPQIVIAGEHTEDPETQDAGQCALAGAIPDDLYDSPGEDLGGRLSTKILESPIGLDGKTGHLPNVYYKAWLSKEAIKRVIGPDDPEVVDFIYHKAKKVFTAVLITIGDPERRRNIIKSLYAHGFSDQELPVTASDIKGLQTSGCIAQLSSNCGAPCDDIGHERCSTKHGARLNTFHHKHWITVDFNQFATNQWKLLIQNFNQQSDPGGIQFRFDLEDNRILPFKHVRSVSSSTGNFSRLSEAQMLAAFQGVIKQDEGIIPVALKQLLPMNLPEYKIDEEWQRECDAYHVMNQRQHDHIVRGICGFQQQGLYYLVLEWANGDNLRQLWRELPDPQLDGSSDSSIRKSRSFVKKIFEQLRGLVEAIKIMHSQGGFNHPSGCQSNAANPPIQEIRMRLAAASLDPTGSQARDSSTPPLAVPNESKHPGSLAVDHLTANNTLDDRSNWRHGDIKPDNILRFLSSSQSRQTDRIGTMKIADLGRAKANYEATMFRQNKSENEMFATMYYEPPDLHLKNTNGTPKRISRLFDIWSMGCVAWETVLWLAYGLVSVNKFVEDSVKGSTIRGFSKSTPYWAKRTNENRAQRSAVLEKWLDLFLGNDGEQPNAIRDLVDVLKKKVFVVELHPNSLRYNPGYRTNAEDLLSELDGIIKKGGAENNPYWYPGFDYSAPERLARCQVWPTPDLESSRNSGLWRTDSRLGAPAVSHGQATAIAMGDEYTHPFTNVWTHELDDENEDDCAMKHLDMLRPSYQNKAPGNICDHCRGFTELGEELTISCKDLEENAYNSNCALCEMIDERLEDSPQDELTFMRSVAGIQLKGFERPLVRICQTPTDSSEPSYLKGFRKGLPSLPDPESSEYFDLLKGIVHHCESSHSCRPRTSNGPGFELPTRLLNVRGRLPKIIETESLSDQEKEHIEYTALSHKWGKKPFLCSTRTNIQNHKQKIKPNKLPKTFVDAIKVTKGLGLDYLWIDSLCILQGLDGDFNVEAERMQSTFGQAYCVIAACDADGAHAGFLNPGRKQSCIRLSDSNLWASAIIDDFECDVLQGTLNKRAWVLQERALARRTLFFTKGQTYFECGKGIRSESLGIMENSLAAFLGDSNFPEYSASHNSSKGGQADLLAYVFELYSRLEFSFATDRPVAIDGLIQRMSISYRDRNVAGMFGRFWGRCLLWERAKDQERLGRIPFNEEDPRKDPDQVPKEPPSWSWMAYDGAIKFLKIEGHSLEWNEAIRRPLSQARFDAATQTSWLGRRRRGESVALSAPASTLDTTCVAILDAYLRYDEGDAPQVLATQCVIIGTTKTPAPGEAKKHYVLLIRQQDGGGDSNYERIGVGVISESCVFTMDKVITIN
ncbi:HET-domain-containing protein [Pyrenochaeta sp. DS3sAY3a]|nr:HET-domain-containing protein [Pyrenochaeta sp. DS3sAY3a]